MKNFKYLLIMFVGLSFAVSCTDDDGGMEKDSLIGTWGLTESESGLEYEITVNFKANATGTILAVISFQGESETTSESFNWSTEGNKLTMEMDGEAEVATYSISGDKLTIIDDEDTTVLTRQ
jgi:hypothetical protein